MLSLHARAAVRLLVLALLGGCSLTQNLDPLQDGVGGSGPTTTSTTSSSSVGVGGAGGDATGGGGAGGAGGGCVTDCLGGDCVDGLCQPVVLWQGLLTGRATGLALHDDEVFWLSSDGVYRMPKVGGSETRLGDDVGGYRITVEPPYAYYTLEDGLYRQPITGGASARVDPGDGRGVVFGGQFVYYVDATSGNEGVYAYEVGTSGPANQAFLVSPATYGDAFGIAIHDNSLFLTTEQGAYRYDTAGPGLVEEFVGAAGDGLAFSGNDMFVLGVGLWRVPLDSVGDPEEIADAQYGQLTADAAHVYFTSDDGRIGRVDFAGVEQELLYQDTPGVDVIAVDDTAVYYTHFLDNRVMRLAK